MQAKIYTVETVNYTIYKSDPSQMSIQAIGTVTSSGWYDGILIPWVYVTEPSDEIMDFDFVANLPTGRVLWVMSPIEGMQTIQLEPWIKGIRVHAVNNKIEVKITEESSIAAKEISITQGDDPPFPWLVPTSK